MSKILKFKFLFSLLLTISLFGFLSITYGDTIEDLKNKISDREVAIKNLEAEIAKTETQIDNIRKNQKTLSGTIATYDAERKKFLAQINLNEQKIISRELEIKSLEIDIGSKNNSLRDVSLGMGEIIREIDALESKSVITSILNYNKLSELWNYIDQSETISASLKNHTDDLEKIRNDLESNKLQAEKVKSQLQNLKKELSSRKVLVENAKAEKEKLLKQTKNQESEYQKILKNQLALRDDFEKELLEFESQLKFEIDPSKIPETGSKILRYPIDGKIIITQYFGKTKFASANPMLYNGQGHNGIDFGIPIGTPIKSSAEGKVVGLGDTDKACPKASYGKWVLVEHNNGLSTLYAHLSTFSVEAGENVSVGETIGLSGNTGYSTGPHLHFTVFATQGVKIMERKSKVCNATYKMPIADLRAYLNPLSYL